VTHNQKGEPTAMVVNAESKVELRVLTTDRAIGDHWLVAAGLAAGDKVIVQGLQGIKPGVKVDAKEVSAAEMKNVAAADPVKAAASAASKPTAP
jgi:membrane fusion protein (multidrug efflux system)